MSSASNSSCYDSQILSESESVPMSNDHQLLSGDLNHVHWSEDDIANVIAVLKSSEALREVHAQSDAYVFLLHSKHVLKLTVFDRFSVNTEDPLLMSNEHEPLSGGSDVVQLSAEEIDDLVTAIEEDETSYEPYAESNLLSVRTEDPLLMPNEHELLSCDSDVVQMSEQMSAEEIATLLAATEDFEASYEPYAESNLLSVDTEDILPMSNEHEPLPGGSNDVQWSEHDVMKLVAAMQSGVSSPEVRALVQVFYDDTEIFLRNINDTLLAGPANAHVNRSQHCTTSTKRKSCHTTQFDDTSSIPKKQHKRRRPNAEENTQGKGKNAKGKGKEKENTRGKFGPYTRADVNATAMAMPSHDPNPVDISSRKILDPSGEPLWTRRYGVMELDDCSYVAGNGNAAKNLSKGLTCVRLCEWDDHPCGLFIEMDQHHIERYMLYWHGVDVRMNKKEEIPCQHADCSAAAQAMQYLGRHIETVHFNSCCQCPYCKKVLARNDAVRRHLNENKCEKFIALMNQAQIGGNDFHPRELIPVFKGYIVPTTSAT
ncbi:hypothetical protein CY34DRAFT_18306 [Suillus luteus UH-Slu-Lm8-n1]|uniref:Uncharacterized protein n=1 Tax=Suillus luteus UH-Slu-Lm8-n1 TaxID=930992 RepID=A0A0D0AH34_9AGAM|nr:hypothetical protein CY34DRAFT_18306 [Suillus luteus UH-Slu-Lm8-n1]